MTEEEQMFQRRHTALEMIEHNKPLREHWLRRLLAALIDFIVVLFTASIIGFMMRIGLWVFSPVLNVLLALLWVFYADILEYLYCATLGKMAMNLKVQSLKGPLDLYKTMIRNLSKVWAPFLILDTLVGMLTEGDPRQRFLDRIAETTVTGAPHHQKGFSEPPTSSDSTGITETAEGALPRPIEPKQ